MAILAITAIMAVIARPFMPYNMVDYHGQMQITGPKIRLITALCKKLWSKQILLKKFGHILCIFGLDLDYRAKG